jgi:hypothetical protein
VESEVLDQFLSAGTACDAAEEPPAARTQSRHFILYVFGSRPAFSDVIQAPTQCIYQALQHRRIVGERLVLKRTRRRAAHGTALIHDCLLPTRSAADVQLGLRGACNPRAGSP